MEMVYDTGSTTTFKIKYLGIRDLEKSNENHYLYIIDDAINQKGYSEHYFTPGYQRTIKYDYRKYNIKNDNALLKGSI